MNSKYLGVPTEGLDFYALLQTDSEFCKELGRAVLAAGRLEAELAVYISQRDRGYKGEYATLGRLISYADENELLKDLIPHLQVLNKQRNYLAHNLFRLFAGIVEETILDRTNLVDSDVSAFTERACLLADNVNTLADIVSERIRQA